METRIFIDSSFDGCEVYFDVSTSDGDSSQDTNLEEALRSINVCEEDISDIVEIFYEKNFPKLNNHLLRNKEQINE